jgi:hypothetical protein
MRCWSGFVFTTLFLFGAGTAFAAAAGSDPAARPRSAGATPNPVVIRGSDLGEAGPSAGEDGSPIVLRGSPPVAEPTYPEPPAAGSACPWGTFYDPSGGCVPADTAYAPYGSWFWPYASDWYWPYSVIEVFPFRARHHFPFRVRHHGFHRDFAHRAKSAAAPRMARRPAAGITHGLSPTGGVRPGAPHFGGVGGGFGHFGGVGRP